MRLKIILILPQCPMTMSANRAFKMCHVHWIVGESQSFACRDDNFFWLVFESGHRGDPRNRRCNRPLFLMSSESRARNTRRSRKVSTAKCSRWCNRPDDSPVRITTPASSRPRDGRASSSPPDSESIVPDHRVRAAFGVR